MTKKKGAAEIKITMNTWPYEKHLKKRGLETKEQLESALFDEWGLNKDNGDSLSVRVVKGKIKL